MDTVSRSMFMKNEIHYFDEIVLEKALIVIRHSSVFPTYRAYFSTDLKTETLHLFDEFFNGEEWSKVKHYFHTTINVRKRNRWYNKAIKDLNEKKVKNPKELYAVYLTIVNNPTLNTENSKDNESHSTTEILAEKIKELDDWRTDYSMPLTSYPYLHEKTKATIKQTVLNDIALILLYFLNEEWSNKTVNNPISEQSIYEDAFDKHNVIFGNKIPRKPLEFDGVDIVDGKKTKFKSVGSSEQQTQLLIEVEPGEGNSDIINRSAYMSDSIRDLDPLDRLLFNSVLAHRDEKFAIGSTITTTLGELVKSTFKSDNKKNYDRTLERLIKLRRFTFVQSDGKERGRVFGFFDYVDWYSDKSGISGSTTVNIIINKAIHDSFINHQTLRIYKEQLDLLDISLHSLLLFIQKERILAHKSGFTRAEITVTKFTSNVRFYAKRKKDLVKEIVKSLDELVKANLLIKYYTNGEHLFVLEFIPMDEKEVQDIVDYGSGYVPTVDNLLNNHNPLSE